MIPGSTIVFVQNVLTMLPWLLLSVVILPEVYAQEVQQRVNVTKAIALDDSKLRSTDATLCGEVETARWLSGELLKRNGFFLSHLGRFKRLRRKADRIEDEERADELYDRALRFRRKHKKFKAICDMFSDGDTDDDSGTPPSDGQFIVEDSSPSFPSGNSIFTFAYHAYLDGKKVFTVAVARNTNRAHALHAVHIGLEYLDNDEDGHCDNAAVCNALASRSNGAIVYMNESQENQFEPWDPSQSLLVTDVYPDSAVYAGGSRQEYDFTLEEVLHYLTDNGWSRAFPAQFGARQNSTWGSLVQSAINRGEYDPTETGDTELDDFETTVPESLYWVISSRTGSQDYSWRRSEIQAEWPNYNRNRLQNSLPELLSLIEDPQYAFPQRLPDGNYAPATQ